MSALLQVRGWTVEAQGDAPTDVVRDVDFELQRGELCSVVGESGSGKTVLFRSLLGIGRSGLRVTRGEAVLHGDSVQRFGPGTARPRAGWAGYVFQHPRESLDPFRTVGAQVAESVRLARPRGGEADVRARLAEVSLDPDAVAGLHPHELSGGMAQRVAIAVAVAAEPALLVADEPTTGLDWSVRRDVVDLLARLAADRGATLVLISHDFAVVRRLADRVLVLYRGERMEDGPRAAFFEPGPGLHPYTRELQARADALRDGRAPPPMPEEQAPSDRGCRYAHRCAVRASGTPDLASRCAEVSPADRAAGPGHRVRCHVVQGGP